jgi:hypothetical protein
MERSVKLGAASVVLIAGCVLREPLDFVCGVLACALGLLAAQQGSKWWLAVPCVMVTLFAFLMYIGLHIQ